jgi:uncharacterized protein (TIGR03083 family)
MSDPRKQAIKGKLAKTRLRLRSLLMQLDEKQWNAEAYHGDEPWTVLQLVRHIVEAEHSFVASLQDIQEGGEGLAADFNIHRWNKDRQREMTDKGPRDLLAEMAQSRAHLLEFIEALDEEDWDKEGRYPSLEIMPVEQYLNRVAGHEAHHTADIAAAVGLPLG